MSVVRCAGCTRRIGVSPNPAPLRSKVWCETRCMNDVPVGANETRDTLITELSRAGRTDGQIASIFGIGRSRVQQIASARRA